MEGMGGATMPLSIIIVKNLRICSGPPQVEKKKPCPAGKHAPKMRVENAAEGCWEPRRDAREQWIPSRREDW